MMTHFYICSNNNTGNKKEQKEVLSNIKSHAGFSVLSQLKKYESNTIFCCFGNKAHHKPYSLINSYDNLGEFLIFSGRVSQKMHDKILNGKKSNEGSLLQMTACAYNEKVKCFLESVNENANTLQIKLLANEVEQMLIGVQHALSVENIYPTNFTVDLLIDKNTNKINFLALIAKVLELTTGYSPETVVSEDFLNLMLSVFCDRDKKGSTHNFHKQIGNKANQLPLFTQDEHKVKIIKLTTDYLQEVKQNKGITKKATLQLIEILYICLNDVYTKKNTGDNNTRLHIEENLKFFDNLEVQMPNGSLVNVSDIFKPVEHATHYDIKTYKKVVDSCLVGDFSDSSSNFGKYIEFLKNLTDQQPIDKILEEASVRVIALINKNQSKWELKYNKETNQFIRKPVEENYKQMVNNLALSQENEMQHHKKLI